MATRQPSDKQILHRLDSSIASLDEQRTENLKRTQLLQDNKDKALKKEQARLRKKYGENHPRIAKINTRLEYNKAALPEMKTEIERSEIETPEFDLNTWMVHGRVMNKNLTGVKGLTLALYDTDGNVEKRLAYACTDERGYYAIRYQVKDGENPPFDPQTDYLLVVSDGKRHICYKEKEPLNVIIGQTDYRLIVIDAATCMPPPDWCNGGNGDGGSQPGEWGVTGTVKYSNGNPGLNLYIHLFDIKAKKDIDSAKTGRTGTFKFLFTTEKDPSLFKNKPDLNIVVTDSDDKQVYISEKTLQPVVGRTEELNIKITV